MKKAFILLLILAPLFAGSSLGETLVECGTDRLLALQGEYTNQNSGDVDAGVHEWVAGTGDTFNNVQGVSAWGLISGWEVLGDIFPLMGSVRTANVLVGRYANDPGRPYAQDVTHLALLDVFTGQSLWGDVHAGPIYGRVIADFSARDNAIRHIAPRGSLAGWDVANHVVAATLAGEEAYGEEMLRIMLNRQGSWVGVLLGGFDYSRLSYGAMIWAAKLNPLVNPLKVSRLGRHLRDAQLANGSWDDDPQTTAYAVLGLGTDPVYPRDRAALAAAIGYLQASASADCGWPYPGFGEVVEVNSEVVTALAMAAPDTLKLARRPRLSPRKDAKPTAPVSRRPEPVLPYQ